MDPATQRAGWVYDTVAKGQLTSATRYVGGAGGAAYTNAVTSYDEFNRPVESKTVIPAPKVP